MELITILFITVFWILCGIISYGLNFAYYQREYSRLAQEDYNWDKRICIFLSLFGPINLVPITIFGNFKYGLKFK